MRSLYNKFDCFYYIRFGNEFIMNIENMLMDNPNKIMIGNGRLLILELHQ